MTVYLFVLSPPYSGSTVAWKLLSTSPNVSAMPDEGQFLEPVRAIFRTRHWVSEKQIPWSLVKVHWEDEWDLSRPILLEKSPPHMMRASEIEEFFKPSYFVIMMRDPYAFCEGYARRRRMTVEESAEFWVRCADKQRTNIQSLERTLLITYETLADDPAGACGQLLRFLPRLESLDPTVRFPAQSIVSYESRKIVNLNNLKIELLSAEEISRINRVLETNVDLLDYYGYETLSPESSRYLKQQRAVIRLKSARVRRRVIRVARRLYSRTHQIIMKTTL